MLILVYNLPHYKKDIIPVIIYIVLIIPMYLVLH